MVRAVGKMILNLIHRPEDNKYFSIQMDTAHRLGLKSTILMLYSSLFNQEIINIVKKYNKEQGDEIGLAFLGMNAPEVTLEMKNEEFAFWLYSFDDKKKIVDLFFKKFYEVFSFYPKSIGCYFMDALIVAYIKNNYPSVEIAIATCFEEGVNTFHGCNNSWYLFTEGGPWSSWIPSKLNIHCPAKDKEEDIGIVAIPHLNRDLLLSVSSRHDFFSSHPSNVMRGMVNEGKEYPYVFNFIDEAIEQSKFNDGYSYYMVFVGPGWIGKDGCFEATEDVLRSAYIEALEYLAQKKSEGIVLDMQMSEYARWHRENKTYDTPTVGLWNDILFDSGKQSFWYIDPNYRITIDPAQGGAIVDFRPYMSRVDGAVGCDTENLWFASYPYIIQTSHRAGYFTHYGKGNIYSCRIRYNLEEVDLCTCRTTGSYDSLARVFTLKPVEIEFENLTIKLESSFTFGDDGKIVITRKILECSDSTAEFEITEYLNGCCGVTEYPRDLRDVTLQIHKNNSICSNIEYQYKNKGEEIKNVQRVQALIPQINTVVSLTPQHGENIGIIRDGFLFSPVFTLELKKIIKLGEEISTCLKAENLK